MTDYRICAECQHHDPMTHLCLHDRARQRDMVTGEMNRQTCHQMRIWPCGTESRFWRPIPGVRPSHLDMADEPF